MLDDQPGTLMMDFEKQDDLILFHRKLDEEQVLFNFRNTRMRKPCSPTGS